MATAATARQLYNQMIAAAQASPGTYDPNQLASQIGTAVGSYISPQEYIGALENIYGPGSGWSNLKFSDSGGSTGGYAAPAYNPDTDPNLLNPVKSQLQQKIAAINALYDALYGDLGTLYQSKRGELDTNLADERNKSQKAYEETARILPTQYASQGIRYSSYYENADKKAGDSYQEGLGSLQKSYDQNLAQLGGAYNQQKTAFDVGKQQLGQINPGAYGSVSQAQGSLQNLNSLEGQLAQQRAGLGTNSQYMQSLNQIAPGKSTVPDALKKQLEELSGASIPGSAKTTIANGIIKQAGTGQDTYWSDYFNKLLSGQGQTTSPLGGNNVQLVSKAAGAVGNLFNQGSRYVGSTFNNADRQRKLWEQQARQGAVQAQRQVQQQVQQVQRQAPKVPQVDFSAVIKNLQALRNQPQVQKIGYAANPVNQFKELNKQVINPLNQFGQNQVQKAYGINQQQLQDLQRKPLLDRVKFGITRPIELNKQNPAMGIIGSPLNPLGGQAAFQSFNNLNLPKPDLTKMADDASASFARSRVGKNPIVGFAGENIARPIVKSFARYGDVTTGQEKYQPGLKGVSQLGTDVFNIGSTVYTPIRAGKLAQGGKVALKAAPGAFGRGAVAGGGISALNQYSDTGRIDPANVALSALLGGTANVALPVALGGLGRTGSKALAGLRKSDVPPSKGFTGNLLDEMNTKFRQGKIDEKQFRAFVVDDFTKKNGRMPMPADVDSFVDVAKNSYNRPYTEAVRARIQAQASGQPQAQLPMNRIAQDTPQVGKTSIIPVNKRTIDSYTTPKPVTEYKVGERVSSATMGGGVEGTIVKTPDFSQDLRYKGNDFQVKLDDGTIIKTDGAGFGTPVAQVGKTDRLIAEARKYKSADEFVKAQGDTLYHGGTKLDKIGNMRSRWGAIYATENPTYAKSFGGKNSVLNEVVVSKDAKLADLRKPSKELLDQITSKIDEKLSKAKPYDDKAFSLYPYSRNSVIDGLKQGKGHIAELPEVKQVLKELGYDGQLTKEVPFASNYGVWNKSKIQTKQQLTDLYNQAQVGKTGKPINELAPKPDAQVPVKASESTINTERLDLTPEQKTRLAQTSKVVRETLSNKDVERIAKNAGIDTRSYTKEQTEQVIAKQLATRQEIVGLERQATELRKAGNDPVALGNLYKQIDDLSRASTEQGTNIARQLQARRIIADETKTPTQRIFMLLDKAGVNPDVYTQKAVGVDFDNPNAVINFYRDLVPAKASDWVDLIRYNSMLSSPLTQIVNATNTMENVAMAPVERTLEGGLDFLTHLVTRRPRQMAGTEGLRYGVGMVKGVPNAIRAFKNTVKGLNENVNIDVGAQGGFMPIAGKGKNVGIDILDFPTTLLGAFDNFHRTLVASGSNSALRGRAKIGVKVLNPEAQSSAEAAYRTFNQDIGDKSQGYILRGLDEVTALVMKARNSKNPALKWPAKLSLPFVRIGANLLKQGIEYSPAGVATIPGALNKKGQLAKAMMGTAVFATAGSLLGQGRLTWARPTDEKQKQQFDAAGMQPYSIKIGDKWVGFAKLPPILSFNLAFVAALDDAQKQAKLNDNGLDNVMTAVAKYGNFLADQSYLKNVGDMLAAVKGDAEAFTKLVGNYPQQFVPERALLGWVARMTDDTQRKINTDANFAQKQVETLFQQIPGLRQTTTAKTDAQGNPLAAQFPFINAFSQLPISQENAEQKIAYNTMTDRLSSNRNESEYLKKLKEDYKKGDQNAASKLTDEQKKNVDKSIKEEQLKKQLSPNQNQLWGYSTDDLKSIAAGNGKNSQDAVEVLQAKKLLSNNESPKNPKDRYQQAIDDYNEKLNNGELSSIGKIKAQKELQSLRAKSSFNQDVVDLYSFNKDDLYDYLTNDDNGGNTWNQLIALDDELVKQGSTSKFRDKYGNIKSLYGSTKKGKAAKGKKGKKAKVAKLPSIRLSAPRKVALAKVAKLRSPKVRYPRLAKSNKTPKIKV